MLSVGLLPDSELTKQAGIEHSPVTGGAEVNQDMMTSIDGVFECGNMLHVHDLVDFVSEESKLAGESAAAYLRGELTHGEKVKVGTFGGVRYCVPEFIEHGKTTGGMSLKMRVGNVYKKVRIKVVADGAEVMGKNKQIVTPGEMETLALNEEQAQILRNAWTVEVGLEVR